MNPFDEKIKVTYLNLLDLTNYSYGLIAELKDHAHTLGYDILEDSTDTFWYERLMNNLRSNTGHLQSVTFPYMVLPSIILNTFYKDPSNVKTKIVEYIWENPEQRATIDMLFWFVGYVSNQVGDNLSGEWIMLVREDWQREELGY